MSFSGRKSSTSDSSSAEDPLPREISNTSGESRGDFLPFTPLQRIAVVVVVGAVAAEVRTHFHFQIRIPPTRLVTAALTFSQGNRWKWRYRWSQQRPCETVGRARPRSVPRCAEQSALAKPAGSPQPHPRDTVDRACRQSASTVYFAFFEARASPISTVN